MPHPDFTYKYKKVYLAGSQVGTAEYLTKRRFSFGVYMMRKGQVVLVSADSEAEMVRWIDSIILAKKQLELSLGTKFPKDGLPYTSHVVANNLPPVLLPIKAQLGLPSMQAATQSPLPSAPPMTQSTEQAFGQPRNPQADKVAAHAPPPHSPSAYPHTSEEEDEGVGGGGDSPRWELPQSPSTFRQHGGLPVGPAHADPSVVQVC